MTLLSKEVKRLKYKKEISQFASGSIYRFNAKTADCYAFNYYTDNSGKVQFEGGWDWLSDLVDKNAEYVMVLSTGKFYKIL